jgi:hypothetical protein
MHCFPSPSWLPHHPTSDRHLRFHFHLHQPQTTITGTLYRIEPQGPRGFEDRTTFNVFDRSAFANAFPLKLLNSTAQGTETISFIASPLHEIKVVSDSGVFEQARGRLERGILPLKWPNIFQSASCDRKRK